MVSNPLEPNADIARFDHEFSRPSSLAFLKSDVKILLRAARDQSMGANVRLVRHGYWRSEELTLDTCLLVVA